jgi:hypothetical protein
MTLSDQANNISVLSDIVNQLKNSGSNADMPGANTTVLHLRLGDGLCGQYDLGSWRGTRCKGAKIGADNARIPNCWGNDTDCFVNQHGAFYAYPRDYYEQVATDLLKSVGNSTRIVVVADPTHWTRNNDMGMVTTPLILHTGTMSYHFSGQKALRFISVGRALEGRTTTLST